MRFRFHLLGLSHLPTSRRYLSCAYTQKNVKLAQMLVDLGHEVYVYGCKSTEGPLPVCTEFIETHDCRDIRQSLGSGDNRFEIGYAWPEMPFRDDFAAPKPVTLKFRANAIREVNARKRPDDFLLLTQGLHHKAIADAVGLYLTCEPGIGYHGNFARWRAFESAFLQNFSYGSEQPRQSANGHFYDRVIPNYFEPSAVEFSDRAEVPAYHLYVGRLIQRKGIRIAAQACRHLGIKLLIAGQGGRVDAAGNLHGDDFTLPPGTWEYVGYADLEKRKRLMAGATACWCPTEYMEPFCGVHVEAMLCFPGNTPVQATAIDRLYLRVYTGSLLQLDTNCDAIECTPEHPFMTQRGWVKACDLTEADMLVRRKAFNHEKAMDSERIGDLVKRLSQSGTFRRGEGPEAGCWFREVQSTETSIDDSVYEYARIVRIARREVANLPVFNLGTSTGTYEAKGFLVHNCGTPVITTDFGVFPETVQNGVNGFRCNTLADFVQAGRRVQELDRRTVRQTAERFLCDNVAPLFDKWFHDLYEVYQSTLPGAVGRGWEFVKGK